MALRLVLMLAVLLNPAAAVTPISVWIQAGRACLQQRQLGGLVHTHPPASQPALPLLAYRG